MVTVTGSLRVQIPARKNHSVKFLRSSRSVLIQYVKLTHHSVFLHRFNSTFTDLLTRSHKPTVGVTGNGFYIPNIYFRSMVLRCLNFISRLIKSSKNYTITLLYVH